MTELFKLAGIITIEGLEAAQAGLKNLETNARNALKPLAKFGRQAQATGKVLTKNITLPLAALGTATTKFAADFQKSMTTSLAIMGDVTDEMRNRMSETAKQISQESTFSASELAKSYYYLASAGYNAEQSIAALGKVAKFAEAGQFDLQVATDLLTDAQSALGLTTKDVVENEQNMVRVSDVLVKANTLANASVQQFSEALTNRAGAAIRILGKDVEEGVAVLAAYADQGVKGAEAGTQLGIVLRDLQKSNQDNVEEFKKAGISVYNTSGEMRNLADIIGDVEKALEGKSDAEKRAQLSILGFQEKSIASLLTLIGTSEKIREYENNLRSAAGTTEEVARKQLQNFSDQLKILWHRLQVVAINLGEKLLPILQNKFIPIIEGLIDKLSSLVDWFNDLHPLFQNTALLIAGIAAAIGPLLIAVGTLSLSLSKLPVIITAVRLAVQALTGVMVTNPIFAVTLAIAGLAIAVRNLYHAYKDVNKQIDENRKKMQEDIEAKQMELKNNLLKELIYNYQKMNEAATSGAPADLYYSIKESVDKLETSLSDLGITFEGSYISRLEAAKNTLRELNAEEIEAIEIIGDLTGEIEDNTNAWNDNTLAAEENAKSKTDAILAEAAAMRQQQAEWDRIDAEKAEKTKAATDNIIKNYRALKEQQAEYDRIDKENHEKEMERKEAEREAIANKISTIGGYVEQVGGLISGLYENEAISIDNNYKRQKKSIENSEKSEEEKKEALIKLDEDFDKKRAALAKKQAIADKAQAIFSIGINTATAIVKALPNLILSGIIGAIGAAQAAIVAARPIPEMAEGGIIKRKTGGTLVNAAEAGEDEGFIPMRKGTASIADAIISNMRRYPGTTAATAEGIAGRNNTNTISLHIGTLVADNKGLQELERRLKVYRISENNRLGVV